MSTTQRIGFGKKIRLDWLSLALRLRAAGADFEASREPLAQLIGKTNKGKVAITKSLSHLRQVVFLPAKENEPFANAGLILFRTHGDRHALEIAWGLCLVSYSFFATTVETAGRLLRLNEAFTASELVRRLSEKAGDRSFVARAGRLNLSSILDWGVVESVAGTRKYRGAKPRRIKAGEIAAWLLEASLHSSRKSALPVQQLALSPTLFPFDLPVLPTASIVALNPRLSVTRQSLSEELVGFKD